MSAEDRLRARLAEAPYTPGELVPVTVADLAALLDEHAALREAAHEHLEKRRRRDGYVGMGDCDALATAAGWAPPEERGHE